MAVYNNRSQEKAERLIKLRDYLYANASPIHAVKIADILTYLANEGHEVEIKTVYSDLNTLKYFFGVETKYDGRQRGYLLLNPPFEPYELRSIVNSIQAAKFITQQEADRLTRKIMKLADKYTRPSLNRQTYVHNRARSFNEKAMEGLDIIYEAIAQDRKISYKYFFYDFDLNSGNYRKKWYWSENGSKIITVSPYGVVWNDNDFCIFAVREGEKKCDRYMLQLAHMEHVKMLTEKRKGREVAQAWIKKVFGNEKCELHSSGVTKLKVHCSLASLLIEKFGNNFTIAPIDNDFFIVTINESPKPDLYIWKLQRLSQKLCKPARWCKIELSHWRF